MTSIRKITQRRKWKSRTPKNWQLRGLHRKYGRVYAWVGPEFAVWSLPSNSHFTFKDEEA